MKLHLPKMLLTAVLAVCTVGATAQAGTGWGTNKSKETATLYVSGTGNSEVLNQNGMTITVATPEGGVPTTYIDATTSGDRQNFIVAADGADNEGVNAEIGTLTIGDGSTMNVAGSGWGTNRHFHTLTIETLGVSNGGNANYTQIAGNSVAINTVNGAVKVTNAGTLTIGEDSTSTTTFSGTTNNTGTMKVNGAVAVTNLDNFTTEVAGTTTWSDTANSQGFRTISDITYVLSTGNVTYANGLSEVSNNGEKHAVTISDDGKATFHVDSLTGTTYYLINTDITAGAAGTEGATGYDVAANRKLSIGSDSAANAKSLLLNTVGAGTIALGTNVTLSQTEATTASGTLSIGSGTTLTVGGHDSHTASISSFNKVELDGGTITFNNKQDTFNNLTTTSSGGVLNFFDMGQVDDGALTTLAGTTTLNGNLTFKNTWNSQITIEKLAGTGDFIINGAGRNTGNSSTISINGVDGYSGKVHITGMASNMKLTAAENLGLQVYVDSRRSSGEKNAIDLTGIGAGNTITLKGALGHFVQNSTIAADVVISNTDDGRWAGMEIQDGYGNSTNTFTGTISGAGNLVLNKDGLANFTQKFTGDVSGWTGKLDFASGNNYVIFTGNSTNIKNDTIAVRAGAGKAANLTFDHASAVTVSSKLERTSGEMNLTLNNSSDAGITFTSDKIQVTDLTLQEGTKAAFTGISTLGVTDLTLAGGTVLSIGSGAATAAEGASPALTVAGAASLAGGAEVQGGLDLSGANVLTLNGIAEGSLVTVVGDFVLSGGTLTLGGDILQTLEGMEAGDTLDVFNVSSFTLDGVGITSDITMADGYTFDKVFAGDNANYYLGYTAGANGGGVVYFGKVVPEPTTATLSLLALAGLAARRRRK